MLDRRGGGKVTGEAENGVMRPEVKEHWQPPEARSSKEGILPYSLVKDHEPSDTVISAQEYKIWTFRLLNHEGIHLYCFKPPSLS